MTTCSVTVQSDNGTQRGGLISDSQICGCCSFCIIMWLWFPTVPSGFPQSQWGSQQEVWSCSHCFFVCLCSVTPVCSTTSHSTLPLPMLLSTCQWPCPPVAPTYTLVCSTSMPPLVPMHTTMLWHTCSQHPLPAHCSHFSSHLWACLPETPTFSCLMTPRVQGLWLQPELQGCCC